MIPVITTLTRVEPGRAKEVVTTAVFTVADDLDLTPKKARAVVRMFLQTMVEHGLDAATARAALPVERP